MFTARKPDPLLSLSQLCSRDLDFKVDTLGVERRDVFPRPLAVPQPALADVHEAAQQAQSFFEQRHKLVGCLCMRV